MQHKRKNTVKIMAISLLTSRSTYYLKYYTDLFENREIKYTEFQAILLQIIGIKRTRPITQIIK